MTDQTDEVPFVAYRYAAGGSVSVLKMDQIVYDSAFVDVEDYFAVGEKQCTVKYWGTLNLVKE